MADLLKDILDNLGEDAAVLWDALNIVLEPDIYNGGGPTLESKWAPYKVWAVYHCGTYRAAWVNGAWINRKGMGYSRFRDAIADALGIERQFTGVSLG